jgi:hypothetical protein
LEKQPPGSRAQISDLFVYDFPSKSPSWKLNVPPVRLYCVSDHCAGERFFRYAAGERPQPNTFGGPRYTFIHYQCSDCRTTRKTFALSLEGGDEEQPLGVALKFGEKPPFGPVTPTRLLSMLGENRDLFMKGRRCESQSLGIGAFVYYRRVVESQREAIIGEIIRVARILNAPSEVLSSLEAARKETQFSKSIELVKDAIPESLRIQGHNPLTLLHDNLSAGLHAKSDEECLEIAQAIRIVLAELAERLSIALKDQAELNRAVGRLLKKQPKPNE